MQPTDLFSLATLIDQVHQWATPFMAAILPWLGFLIGISLVFIVGKGIINFIEDKLDREEDEADVGDFQTLLGIEQGSRAYTQFQSFSNLSDSQQRYLTRYAKFFEDERGNPQTQVGLPIIEEKKPLDYARISRGF